VAVRVARLAFGSRAKYRRYIVEAFDVRFGREVQIATIRLRFAGEGVLQILFRLTAFEIHDSLSFRLMDSETKSG
jgi:hypothetical protein